MYLHFVFVYLCVLIVYFIVEIIVYITVARVTTVLLKKINKYLDRSRSREKKTKEEIRKRCVFPFNATLK